MGEKVRDLMADLEKSLTKAEAERLAAQGHDSKGFSEEKCLRCGWVMGRPPLNCQNDNTPHVFPSQVGEGNWPGVLGFGGDHGR